MARTGLRMMPTFPLPPLKFRTAGFPQYGFKAGFSDAAFPADWFAIVLRALRCHRDSPALCQGRCACKHLRASGPPRSTPGALAPVRVILSRSIITCIQAPGNIRTETTFDWAACRRAWILGVDPRKQK